MFHNSSTRSVANVPDVTMIRARASSVVTITTKDTQYNWAGMCRFFIYQFCRTFYCDYLKY